MSTALPDVVGVYGGGRMGAGIAHAMLLAGARVVVVEADPGACEAARSRVLASLRSAAERGGATSGSGVPVDPEPLGDRLRVGTDPTGLAAAGLVIESVPEDQQLKVEVLRVVEGAAPGAALATNTSALSIDALARTLRRPDRFLGLHFFNPVPASTLVEIVVGTDTDAALVERARGWVAALGKTSITVSDSPGFASSRLGVALALEAIRMLEDGIASATDIDTAMTLGYRHAVGPLRTTDLVGLDIRLSVARHLHRELGARFRPPRLLIEKVAAGELGRKTGRGFFEWP